MLLALNPFTSKRKDRGTTVARRLFMSRTAAFLILTTAAAIFGIMWLVWPRSSTDEQIKEMLRQLASHGTFEGQIHPIALARLSAEVSQKFFGEHVHLEGTYQGEQFTRSFSRDEVAQQIAAGRRMMAQFATRFESVEVVPGGKDRVVATLELRAIGRAVGASTTDYFLEIFAVTATLERGKNDQWRIVSAEAEDLRNAS